MKKITNDHISVLFRDILAENCFKHFANEINDYVTRNPLLSEEEVVDIKSYINNLKEIYFKKPIKSFLLKNSVLEDINSIKNIEQLRFSDIMNFLPEAYLNDIYINKNQLLRVSKFLNYFILLFVEWFPNEKGFMSYHNIYDTSNNDNPFFTKSKLTDMQFILIKKTIGYIFLSDIKEICLAPKGKIGFYKEDRIINETRLPFIVVDKSWNTTTIREDGFKVKGHLRFQRYGHLRSDRKFIYINEFGKNGYRRNAKKISVLNNNLKIKI